MFKNFLDLFKNDNNNNSNNNTEGNYYINGRYCSFDEYMRELDKCDKEAELKLAKYKNNEYTSTINNLDNINNTLQNTHNSVLGIKTNDNEIEITIQNPNSNYQHHLLLQQQQLQQQQLQQQNTYNQCKLQLEMEKLKLEREKLEFEKSKNYKYKHIHKNNHKHNKHNKQHSRNQQQQHSRNQQQQHSRNQQQQHSRNQNNYENSNSMEICVLDNKSKDTQKILYQGKNGIILNNYLNYYPDNVFINKYLNCKISLMKNNEKNNMKLYFVLNDNLGITVPNIFMNDSNIYNCIKSIMIKVLCYSCCSLEYKDINNSIQNCDEHTIMSNYIHNENSYINELFKKMKAVKLLLNEIMYSNLSIQDKKNKIITFSTMY